MAKEKLVNEIPLGTYDVFRDINSWDEQTASQWVKALNLRADSDDQKRLRTNLISMAHLKLNDIVVEIGCGTGAFLFDLAKVVGSGGCVIGIEPQRMLADYARGAVRDRMLDLFVNIETVSAECLPVADNSADACFAQTVLIHLPQNILLKALNEMSRVIKKGGRIVSADQDGDTWIINHPEREVTRRIIQFNSDQRYADGWTGRRLESLFRNAGLIEVKTEPLVYIDRSPESYLFGMAKRISASAKEAGVLSEKEYLLWISGLENIAKKGDFFSSINYYCCLGIKPGKLD